MPADIKLLQIPNVDDGSGVQGSLRKIAREIDPDPAVTPRGILILQTCDGYVQAYGLGDMPDTVRAIGILAIAQFTLIRGTEHELKGNDAG